MPYYIGDVIKDYKRLVIRTPEDFQKTGIDVKIKTRVEDIDSQKGLVRLSDGSSLSLRYPRHGHRGRRRPPGHPGGRSGRGLRPQKPDGRPAAQVLSERERMPQSRPDRRRLHRDGDVRGPEKPGNRDDGHRCPAPSRHPLGCRIYQDDRGRTGEKQCAISAGNKAPRHRKGNREPPRPEDGQGRSGCRCDSDGSGHPSQYDPG